MLLILCGLDDLDALAFAHRARAAGTEIVILTAEALSFARRRSHRIGSTAGSGGAMSVRTEIAVDGLPTICPEQLTGVLNRLAAPPDAAWRRAAGSERDYAGAELFAFTLSWLDGLACPVRNRPTPGCLAGPAPHPLVAAAAAARAGLQRPALRYRSSVAGRATDLGQSALAATGADARPVQLVCLDGRVLTDGVPAEVRDPVASMLDELGAGTDLVGVDFAVGGGRWVFAGLTPLPAIGSLTHVGRQALLDVLAPVRAAVA